MNGARGIIIGLLLTAIGLNGCAALLIGAGATGGYAISRDSVTNHFDLSKSHVYGRALKVAHDMGLVKVEDESHGLIEATINEANVTITVSSVTKKTVQLKVKARNQFLMPKVSVAQDVYANIAEGL